MPGAATRRQLVFGAVAAGVMPALGGCAAATRGRGMSAPVSSPSPVVLVHGAWHGGWCWDDLRPLLHGQGFATFAPTLTGLAERRDEMNASIGLETHIADVERVIVGNDLRDVTLVGHSYGGMVITAIADRMANRRPGRLGRLVYLDAALPDDGDSMVSYAPGTMADGAAVLAAELTAMSPDGIVLPPLPATAFGIAEDHPRRAWVEARLTPHPLKTWLDPIRLANGGAMTIPRTYIHCVAPVLPRAGFPAIAAMAKASDDWRYAELQTGHDAMVTAPAKLATLIAAAMAAPAA